MSYRDGMGGALGKGFRFAALYATGGGERIRVVLVAPDGALRVETFLPHW